MENLLTCTIGASGYVLIQYLTKRFRDCSCTLDGMYLALLACLLSLSVHSKLGKSVNKASPMWQGANFF